jgi:hypothetical protein
MSLVPPGGGLHKTCTHGWGETVRYALDDTARTVRLCVILIVMGSASAGAFLIMLLVHGLLH